MDRVRGGGGDADGRGHWSFCWHGQASWPHEYTQHKPIPTLIVPDMPSKCANRAVRGSRGKQLIIREMGGRPFMYTSGRLQGFDAGRSITRVGQIRRRFWVQK